ncbi:MAG: hypothetical protein ABH835_04545 [Patescibacteria group bacterium]
MPTPSEKELKDKKGQGAFISRCVVVVMKEGKTQKQALGQCFGMYKQAKKKAKAGEEPSWSDFETDDWVILP